MVLEVNACPFAFSRSDVAYVGLFGFVDSVFFLGPPPSFRAAWGSVVIRTGFDGVSMTAKICPQGKIRLH